MKVSLFLLCIAFALASSLQGVVGEDGAKPRYSQNEVVNKIDNKQRTGIKCYTCNGCSDAKKLTSGTKEECKGDPYYGEEVPYKQSENNYMPVDGESTTTTTKRPILGYYKPRCFISFGAHGVVARGCLSSFLDQHTLKSGKGDYNGTSEDQLYDHYHHYGAEKVEVNGKCADMTHKKKDENYWSSHFTCWCEGNLCNFGFSLRSSVNLGGVVAGAVGVVIFNALYTL